MCRMCLLGLVLLSALSCLASNRSLVLAERGKAVDCTIVIPGTNCPSVVYAAHEFRDFVRRQVGVELPITERDMGGKSVVLKMVGSGDAFRIRTSTDGLEVCGGPRGILYGAYEVLETYGGIRWFSSRYSVVPQLNSFALPLGLDVTSRPAFQCRSSYYYDALDPDFAARIRCNASDHRLQPRHGGACGRMGKGMGSHTFSALVPFSWYGKIHPEYFCLRDGKRQTHADPDRHLQPCLTNPDVIKIATENLLKAIERDPTADAYSVSQNDNLQYCMCERCAAVDREEGSHAGTLIRFVNALAEAVERKYPDKTIKTLAYQYTRKPPKTSPRKNVSVLYCTIECDFSHPLRTGRHPDTISIMRDLQGWSKLSRRVEIWDYVTQFSAYYMPFANLEAEVDNIKFYRDCGVTSLLAQGCYNGYGADLEELRCWLLAKLMWNPDRDEFTLVDEFCRGYYGKAAPYVRQYYDMLRKCPRTDIDYKLDCCYSKDVHLELISDEFLEAARGLWRQAEAAVVDESWQIRENVRNGAFGVDCTCYRRAEDRFKDIGFSFRREGDVVGDLRRYSELARRVRATMRSGRKILIADGGLGSKVQDFMAGLDRAVVARPREPKDSVLMGADELETSGIGTWCDFVADAGAKDGRALKFRNNGWDWCTGVSLPGGIFDVGVRYRVRVRAKVVKKEGGVDNAAISAGVYNFSDRRVVAEWSRKASELKDRIWQWIDFGEFCPQRSQSLWLSSGIFDRKRFAANPAIEATYIDQLEISRVVGK